MTTLKIPPVKAKIVGLDCARHKTMLWKQADIDMFFILLKRNTKRKKIIFYLLTVTDGISQNRIALWCSARKVTQGFQSQFDAWSSHDVWKITCGTWDPRTSDLSWERVILVNIKCHLLNAWKTGAKPAHLKIFSMQLLCLNRALTTGVPLGTSGALRR